MSRPGEEDHDHAYDARRDAEMARAGRMAERLRIVEWLREKGLNPDKIADARYDVEPYKRDALADDIEHDRHWRDR